MEHVVTHTPDQSDVVLHQVGSPQGGTPSARAALEGEARGRAGESGGGREAVRSLYIHTPFCVHKCHYCDFYSFVDKKDQQAAFADRLIEELRGLSVHACGADGTPRPLRTIFVGGGTPSLMRVELWERVLKAMAEVFDLSMIRAAADGAGLDRRAGVALNSGGGGGGELRDRPLSAVAPGAEFTVECNPESTSAELMALLRQFGVGRVSVGAQSFNPRHLKTLERWHDPANVQRAIELARAAGIGRQSVDLIYGVPGQTLAEWASDLETALGLNTTHLSCYNLTYEATTAMTARLRAGEFVAVEDEVEADMFEMTGATLATAGLRRYEVSNYAVPGQESRHNLAYWWHEQWLAAGPSASGHVYASGGGSLRDAGSGGAHVEASGGGEFARAGHRWKNRPALAQYLDFSDGGYAPVTGYEPPDPRRAVRERLMTGIRLCDGVEVGAACGAVGEVAGAGAATAWRREIDELVGDGLLVIRGARVMVTQRGWLVADFIAKRLMRAVEDVR